MRKQELQKVYRTFWAQFASICRSAGAVSKPDDGTIQLDISACTPKQLVITTCCYFPDWRYRTQSRSERVHIIVQSREAYSTGDDKLIQSNVHVLYLRVSGSKADPLLGLHYDFVSPVQTAHPVFHAQFGARDIDAQKLRRMGFEAVIGPPPKGTLYANVRIPTACMNFISVLLGLAADHLDPPVFNKVLNLVRASDLTKKWNATCDSLQASLKDVGGYLPSHHWYEAMRAQ